MSGQLETLTQAPPHETLFVTDLNARLIDDEVEARNWRVHRVQVNGKVHKHTFKPDEALEMPFDQAMKYMQTGWVVKDAGGSEYAPPPAAGDRKGTITLAPGQVVANLDELTIDALKIRVATMPKGETLARAKKAELIDFINHHNERAIPKVPDAAVEAGSALSASEIDDLMGEGA